MTSVLEKKYLECACSSSEHTIHLTIDHEDKNIYLHVGLSTGNFWYRFKVAISYIFGYKCKYGFFDEVVLEKTQQDKLIQILESLK